MTEKDCLKYCYESGFSWDEDGIDLYSILDRVSCWCCCNKNLKELNLDDVCSFDITLARGQNYYTGNVFEVYDKEQRIKGSIAAGGRYDKMIGNFIGDGEEYPTVGISFGLSSIYEIVKSRFEDEKSDTLVYIIPMDTKIECIKMANMIRENGYTVEVEMVDKKLKKSRRKD